jgi:hypothetical protein
MKVLTKNRLRILIVLATVFLLTTSALASSVASYEANWYTVDGGGGNSSGGAYTLSGTIGQADAGMLSGGTYTLAGGFWSGAGPLGSQLYLPVITK